MGVLCMVRCLLRTSCALFTKGHTKDLGKHGANWRGG